MIRRNRSLQYTAWVLLTLSLAACSSIDLEETIPLVFDLNGEWQINHELSDLPPDQRKMMEQAQRRDMEHRPNSSNRAIRNAGSAMSFVNHDFPVLVANEMKIEQNADSMGIRYDKGAYRDVSWGYRERGLWEVTAGWSVEGNLVIYSETDDAEVTETYSLQDGRKRLVVVIQVDVDRENFIVTRVYDRG
ncbi:MAG: hypothetical protein O3A63_10225 [Proteobacteria bacterium]|nr:hypothetical protein [Pseudomonadota bacterium]